MNIEDIIDAIRQERIRVTDHADEEAHADHLRFDEIFNSVIQGEIIEEYPEDRPYPRCVIYGNSSVGKPIHSVWAYDKQNGWAVLVTVYRPDPRRWIDGRTRREP